MAAHLNSGRVNFGLLRETARRELLQCLDKCVGSKAIVWDSTLTGPFGLFAEYSLLKEHEVEAMYPLNPGRLPPTSGVQNIIFITRPNPSQMEIIAENVLKEEERGNRKEYGIFFVPRKTMLCERRLQDLGVFGTFAHVDEYPLDLIPFDSDLLSLEMDNSFKECYLENDLTSLFYVANSLMTLQALFGIIPKIYGKGDMAERVADMIMRKRREMADVETQIPPQIDSLLLIDRNVDLLTPLCTQLTYEGLIDEFYGIQNTTAKFPAEHFNQDEGSKGPGTSQQSQGPKKVILNSGDQLYCEIRDLNFQAVGPVLSRRAKYLSAAFEEHKDAKTVGEMKQFVHKLPHIQAEKQSLALHTTIATLVKERIDTEEFRENLHVEQEFLTCTDTDKVNSYIEKSIGLKEPLLKVLRLICIQCLTNSGFKPKLLEYYKREVLQTYGFDHIYKTLSPLENVGLLKVHSLRSFPTLSKSLILFDEGVNEQNPTDISYVHSGYAPLSVRLAQSVAKNQGWRGLEEILPYLPGKTFEYVQHLPSALQNKSNNEFGEAAQRITLVYFIGGCSFSEVAALRFLSQQESGPTDYVIATTKLINGTSWIESIMENEDPNNPFI